MNFFEQIDDRLSPQQMHIIFYVLLFIATVLNFFAYFFENIAFDNWYFNYYASDPNFYRLYLQFAIFIHSLGFDFFLFIGIVHFVLFALVYYSLKPKGLEYLLLIFISNMPMPFQDTMPIFLLFLVVKYSDSKWSYLLLIPLALVKEVVAWTGFWYLFLTMPDLKSKIEISLSAFAGVVSYIIMRLLMGEVPRIQIPHPSGDPVCPFFSPPHWIKLFLNNTNNIAPAMIISTTLILVFLYFLIKTRNEAYIVGISIIPILFFGAFFLVYLYFPIAIVVVTNRLTVQKQHLTLLPPELLRIVHSRTNKI